MLRTSTKQHIFIKPQIWIIRSHSLLNAWLLCSNAICCRYSMTDITASHFVRTRGCFAVIMFVKWSQPATSRSDVSRPMYMFWCKLMRVILLQICNKIWLKKQPQVWTNWLAVMPVMEQQLIAILKSRCTLNFIDICRL